MADSRLTRSAALVVAPTVLLACGVPGESSGPECDQYELPGMRIDKVDDDIYVVASIAGRNSVPSKTITFVLTDEGVVAFDAGSESSAAQAKEFLRGITDLPLKWIVYSHHHGTQTQGARALMDEDTKFIAHEDTAMEIGWISDLQVFNRRLNSIQFNLNIPHDADFADPPLPDVTYGGQYTLELGGQTFELHHVEGEARDYTVVWMPERRYVWVADLVNDSFPMVASPMKPVRDPLRWKDAVDHVRALEPAVMVNAVDPPYCDPQQIQDLLGLQSRLLSFLHRAVAEQIDAGATEEQALRAIQLPAEFADLSQGYGSLEFAVRGIYQLYTGFWDQNASSLHLVDHREQAKAFVASMGGADAVLAKAESLAAENRVKLALSYADLLIDSERDLRALRLKADLLARLADQPSPNRIAVNMLRYLSNYAAWSADRPDKAFKADPGMFKEIEEKHGKGWSGGKTWRAGKANKSRKAPIEPPSP